MNTFDIVILVIVAFGIIKGYMRGFIVEFLSFIAFFLGLFLALELTVPVASWLFKNSSFSEVKSILVFIGLFVLLSIGIKLGAKIIKGMVDATIFGRLDNLVGALAGGLKWAFLISIVVWVSSSVGIDLVERYGSDAIILPYIVDVGPEAFHWLSKSLPFIRDLIDSLENLTSRSNELMTNGVSTYNGSIQKA